MELLSGAEMIVRFLADEGIEYIYGYPGGAALHTYDALYRQDKVKHILVRHEQAATHMADGYSRVSGKPGVVLVTSGPGATNTVTGIATAYMDSIPMVIITSQVMSHLIGEDAFQETDIIGVTRPIVKHSFSVNHQSEIPTTLKKAFYLASTGRPGPVLVDIPKDMTAPNEKFPYEYPDSVEIRSYAPTKKGHSGQIKKAATLLAQASKPVLFVGGGVLAAGASSAVESLAKKLNLPVVTSLMGIGAYDQLDSQSLGWLGMHGTYESNMAMHNSDLVLGIGARFDDRATNNVAKFCPTAKIIHIDVDPSSIGKSIRVDIPIVGDALEVLQQMNLFIEQEKFTPNADLEEWWKNIEIWREKSRQTTYKASKAGELLKPQEVVEEVYAQTKGDAIVVTDVGQHQMFAAQHYKFAKPRRLVTSGGLGTMGFGLPAAMGVKLHYPEEEVVLFTSEGSFQMLIQELSTCKQYNLPIKIIHLSNNTLGMVRQWQDLNYQSRHSESYMESLPDFKAIIEAYGHIALEASTKEDMQAVIAEAFSIKDKLVFVNIAIDPEEHVYPMQVAGGSMQDMIFERVGGAK